MSTPSCKHADDSFGPSVGHCRGGFDFTLLFEESVLSVLPLVLLLGAAPLRVLYLFRRSIKADGRLLLLSKLILYAAFTILQLVLVALWASHAVTRTKLSVANSVLSLAGSCALVFLSIEEHRKTIQPSLTIESYLALSLIFDIARVRTLWLQGYNNNVAAVTTASSAIKFVLLLAESTEKRSFLRSEWRKQSPEATSGLFGKTLFWWLNGLFLKGYSHSLQVEDLLPLDKHLTSHYLYHRLKSSWANSRGQRSLLLSYFIQLRWTLLSVIPPRLGLIGFNFCQPFLIERTISFTQQPVTEGTKNVGYGLIGAYFLVYCGIAFTAAQYQHLTYRAITMARGGLVSMLFAKSSTLESAAIESGAALTLMSADIERITNGWQSMHEIWANSIEIAVAIYLLARQLGVACTIPLAVAIVSLLGSFCVTNMVVHRQAIWLEAIEKRISATSTMLGSMKRIKMCGLTDTLFETVHGLRLQELRISKAFRRLVIQSMFFAFTTPVIAPVLTFTVFSLLALRDSNSSLDVTTAFTSLSLFALLSDPMASLVMSMTAFAGSFGSFSRIQAFLDKPEHDQRCVKSPETESEKMKSSETTGSSELSVSWSEKPVASAIVKSAIGPLTRADGDAICIEDGTFGWDAQKDPLLCSIQLKAPRGKVTMVVGRVGCGKSTLLKALLGEVPARSGTIKHCFAGDISYCDQSPFHMNGTVRESIMAFAPVDERWYSTVVGACALTEDLRQLPLGDQTRIGSKGIALSGGQSQRLALARAAYARQNLCILDDVFSGLDADTEARVFHSLLGMEGLFRRQRATVVLASSSTKRLPLADHIVVLGEKGKVAEQGTYAELAASGGFVSGLGLPPAEWGYDSTEATPMDQLVFSAPKVASLPPPTEQSEAATQAEANKRTGDLSIYAYYAGSVGWLALSIFVISVATYVFCISFPQIWLGWWSSANAKNPNGDLGYWLGIYAVLGVAGLFAIVISCWQIIVTMVPQSGGNFHSRLLHTVLTAPMSFFATIDTGITLNRFSQDLQLIDMDLPISALNTVVFLLMCFAQIILIGVSSKYAAISVPFLILVVYLLQNFYLRTSRQLRFLDLEAKSPLYTQFAETIAGLTTIRAFGWQRALERRNRHMLDQSQRPFYLLYAVQRWLQMVLDLIVAAVAVLLIVLAVELKGSQSGVYVGIALLNVILFSQDLKYLLQFWTMLETHIGAISRIKTFTSMTAPEDSEKESAVVSNDWPAQGSITFDRVSASYDGTRKVLKDLSLSIQPGEKVGICGRTGSGKSSLILAIFRMVELHGGTINIDGVDISTIPRHEVRSRIIGLPQDVFLLSSTVRLNVDPYKKATDKAIIEVLEDVTLWSEIQEKGGLDAEVDGLNLSHGQKQLFCLAQALIRSSSILILDEATSSVDDVTDALIQRIIRRKFAKHTIIAVAHKLETIIDFDKVVVLDNGTLREIGNPNALLNDPSSAFRQLYRG